MTITFDQACTLAATEFHLLAQSAENPSLFDQAVQAMRDERYTCNTKTGTTRNRYGVQAQFTAFDWANEYDENPHFVFYDFFRGHLLNKYSRLLRGC